MLGGPNGGNCPEQLVGNEGGEGFGVGCGGVGGVAGVGGDGFGGTGVG